MQSRLAGVALQLAALATFVAMDTIIKLMTASFAVPQVMWARFVFGFVTVAIALRLVTGHFPWRSRAPGTQTLRSLILAACNWLFTTALVHIPLADATAVGFASPLLTVALLLGAAVAAPEPSELPDTVERNFWRACPVPTSMLNSKASMITSATIQ